MNFKKVFGIVSIIGTAIVGAASIGKEVTKYKEENPKDDPLDDGHAPSPEEAAELAESCPENNTEEEMINNVIEESEEKED